MTIADDNAFLQAMEGVDRQVFEPRVNVSRQASVCFEARRAQAQAQVQAVVDPLSDEQPMQVEPMAVLSFCRTQVGERMWKRLRTGRLEVEARLDLHDMRRVQARQCVYQFVQDCLDHQVHVALIAHGTGWGRENPAQLKSALAVWLPQLDDVLAFHSAKASHGGVGAIYLLLRSRKL